MLSEMEAQRNMQFTISTTTGEAQPNLPFPSLVDGPKLLVQWHAWWPQFLNNIADLFRATPQIVNGPPPGEFWPDVFVDRSLPLQRLGYSAFFHAAFIFFMLATGKFWFRSDAATAQDPYQNTTLTYYKVDEFLPEVKPQVKLKPAPVAQRKVPQKADPVLAKQEIISISARADNRQQTIINPPFPKLIARNILLPNLVAASVAPAPPIAALTAPKITMPNLQLTAVQPPVELPLTHSKLPDLSATAVVQPAPNANDVKPRTVAIASLQPAIADPKLAVPESSVIETIRREVSQMEPPPPPAPSTAGLTMKPSGQLMALSLHPEPPAPEIKIPNGSRAGEFAASPQGKSGASGQPEVKGETDPDSALGGGHNVDVLPQISIAGAPLNPKLGAVVAGPVALPPKTADVPSKPTKQLAMNAPSADIGRKTFPHYGVPAERKPEDKVFAGKRIYSMQLNMPNLTSSGGSWIIRFAELKENGQAGDLSTPVVTNKVDPAYPQDLMRDRVEGTVVLYAIIRADGSVDDVRVLQGLHDILDENARIALGRWHFRPAMKNGEPIDLEAVVQIPFRARRSAF